MRDWFRRLMMGRYGVDQLTWVLLALSLVISLCGSIFQIKGFSILCWAVLVVCYLRIFSRNIYARQQENQKLLQFWWKLKNGRARSEEPAQPGGTQKVQGIHLPHLQAEAAGAARQGEDQYFLSQMRDELYQKDITKGPSAEGSFFDGWDEKAPGGIGGIGSGALCYCIILRVGVSPRAFW